MKCCPVHLNFYIFHPETKLHRRSNLAANTLQLSKYSSRFSMSIVLTSSVSSRKANILSGATLKEIKSTENVQIQSFSTTQLTATQSILTSYLTSTIISNLTRTKLVNVESTLVIPNGKVFLLI